MQTQDNAKIEKFPDFFFRTEVVVKDISECAFANLLALQILVCSLKFIAAHYNS